MADLLDLVRDDTTLHPVARTNGGELAGPCPFCGGDDRFRCWPDHPDGAGGQWWCRQCGRGGDSIAYCVETGDLTPREAGRLRHSVRNEPHKARRARQPGKALVPGPLPPPPVAWRERAGAFVSYCQRQLFKADNEGLDHLRDRGLTDKTILRWGLGWHDRDRWRDPTQWGLEIDKRIYLARGVVIPWTLGGETWHVKTRLFETWKGKKTPKYMGIRGGRPTLYGLDHLLGKRAAVICEGELDAVLLHQQAGDLVDVVAIGCKKARPRVTFLAHLVGASCWLLALDGDAEDETSVWRRQSERVRRMRPLQGNDVTDFHMAGGDLRAWVQYHLSASAQLGAPGAPSFKGKRCTDALVE